MTSSGAISSASIVSMAPNQEDWGPGPPSDPPSIGSGPPPEFRIPPPPLPSFMLPDDLDHEDFCQTTSLDTHLDVCDTTFPSIIKSTSGHFPLNSNSLLNHWMALILGAGALFILTLCLAIFLTWRRWRGRNRLSYLRTKSSYDSHRETSEHPLIYDDANIHFYRSNHASSSSNTYLMDRRPIVRDLSGLSQQTEYSCHQTPFFNSLGGQSSSGSRYDNESRIYEEVFLTSNQEDHYAGASNTGTGNGLYAKPLGDEDTAPLNPVPLQTSSRLIFCHNGSDIDQWPHPASATVSDDLQSGYSAVYVANNGLAESSFSTSSTSDQARSSSRGHSSMSSGPTTVTRLQRGQKQPQHTMSSCSSSSEDNNCSLRLHGLKENGKCRSTSGQETSIWRPSPMPVNAQNACGARMPNNLSDACWQQPPQPQTVNRVVQQKKEGGLLSSLWRKRSKTQDNKNLRPMALQQQQPLEQPQYPFSATQGWMTLRVPPHLPISNGQSWANGQFYRDASGGHIILRPQQQPLQQPHPGTRTLGRNYGINHNNANNIVMPNPDDILPKEAWTDFSGTDEWPRFSGLERRRSASDAEDEADNGNSEKRQYVNRRPEHCQTFEDNGNRVCPREQPPPLLNGLQSESSESSNNNNNGLHERGPNTSAASQQIENNLMGMASSEKEDNLTKNQNDIWQSQRPTPVARNQRPPQPPKRVQQQQNSKKKDQRNPTTKQRHQQPQPQKSRLLLENNKEVNVTTFSLNHTNDTSNGGCHSEAEESDNEVMERSPLFKPLDDKSTQWHNSPLQ